MLLVAMLSFAKESVAAKDDAESVGMAKGLFVLMAIGVFYLGHQVGQASGYITSVSPFLCVHGFFIVSVLTLLLRTGRAAR